jgi:hypothetical protein
MPALRADSPIYAWDIRPAGALHETVTADLKAAALGTVHARASDEVLSALETSPRGLSEDDARRRLADHGANRLPEPE